MNTYGTSVWLTKQISKFCLSNNISEQLVCRCLETTKEQANSTLLAEGLSPASMTDFQNLYTVYNAEHTAMSSTALPGLVLSSFSFYPVTVDLKINDMNASLFCTGLTSVKITQSKQLASRFVLVYGTQKVTFYIVQGLYPWLLVCCSIKDRQFSIGVPSGYKSVIKVSSTSTDSKNARAQLVARNYNKLTLAVEQIQKLCSAEDCLLYKLIGSPLDLRKDTHYPDTHKSPIEHIRKAHVRTMSNGKQVYVREAIVGIGCK